MKKTAIILLIITFIGFFIPSYVRAEKAVAEPVNLYFFWGEGCPHCSKEKPFLDKMEVRYPQLNVYDYEIWNNPENLKLMIDFGNKLNANVSGVPFTIIGEQYFVGWLDENSSGRVIEDAIKCSINNQCRDVGQELSLVDIIKNDGFADSLSAVQKDNQNIKEQLPIPTEFIPLAETDEDSTNFIDKPLLDLKNGAEAQKYTPALPESIGLPFIGEINIKDLSLPALAVVLGALDGFNPCAMWTLLFLISLLLGMQDRKRMWILGSAFIIASASVYFLFMSAWLNLLLFIGFIFWVRLAVGLVALGGGGYNLKEYFSNPQGTCKVTGTEKRQAVFAKLKNIATQQSFYLALGGIIILAFAVNLVELICSAGLPVVFTQILTLSGLSSWQYYLYILLYIFIFMLDDLFVFIVAMTTLKISGVTTKYSRFSHLIGGVLMIIVGLLLIFRPEWLMFG